MTKTQLRKRWSDPGFVSGLAIPRERAPRTEELSMLDLRGVPKLGNGDPLWHFQILSAAATDIDLSFGDGVLQIVQSSAERLRCEEFRFDRATLWSNSSFTSCDFQRARLRLAVTDCVFDACSFELSTFAGGYSEYGFKRCTFRNCSFKGARWSGTYLRACRFEACDFVRWQILDSIVAGFKHRECRDFSPEMFIGGDIRPATEC